MIGSRRTLVAGVLIGAGLVLAVFVVWQFLPGAATPDDTPPATAPLPIVAPSPPPPAPEVITFNRHIAPMVFEHCATCHRPGQSAPTSLLTYHDVMKRRTQIGYVLQSRYMPPWLPAPTDYAFHGDRRLSAEQIAMFKQWTAQGGPEGDPSDLPPPPRFATDWQLGEPDLVVQFSEPYMLRADGPDVFRNFLIELPIEQTRYVKSFEFRPANPRVVHHASFNATGAEDIRGRDAADPGPGFDDMRPIPSKNPRGFFIGWVPGRAAHPGTEDYSWRIDPGDGLVVQLHMLPSGKVEPVMASIGLYFAQKPPPRSPLLARLGLVTLDIPPKESNYITQDAYRLPVDVELMAVVPHAHYLGKEMVGLAVLPDGAIKRLLHIPQWDFNWQEEYRFAEPIALPRGTVLQMQFSYDNTSQNPRNQNQPPQRVVYGPRSSDEMGDLWFQLVPRNDRDFEVLYHDLTRRERRLRVAGWEKRLQVVPDDTVVLNQLALHHAQMGQLDVTIELLQRAVNADDSYTLARGNLAQALAIQGHYDRALVHYRKLVALEPRNAQYHDGLGMTLASLDDTQGATDAFRRAVEIDSELVTVRAKLAASLYKQDHIDAALEQYLLICDSDPQQLDAFSAAAWILCTHPVAEKRNPERAMELSRIACEGSDYANGDYLETWATACRAAGRTDEGIELLTTALQQAGDSGDDALVDRVDQLTATLRSAPE